jgi:hypothetical protein
VKTTQQIEATFKALGKDCDRLGLPHRAVVMTNHFIFLDDGRIVFRAAGTKVNVLFWDETEAAEHIAATMWHSDHFEMSHSSSCDFPDEFGRPDFDYDDFKDLIHDQLEKRRHA